MDESRHEYEKLMKCVSNYLRYEKLQTILKIGKRYTVMTNENGEEEINNEGTRQKIM